MIVSIQVGDVSTLREKKRCQLLRLPMPHTRLPHDEARWHVDTHRQQPNGQVNEKGISIHVENIREEEKGDIYAGLI